MFLQKTQQTLSHRVLMLPHAELLHQRGCLRKGYRQSSQWFWLQNPVTLHVESIYLKASGRSLR